MEGWTYKEQARTGRVLFDIYRHSHRHCDVVPEYELRMNVFGLGYHLSESELSDTSAFKQAKLKMLRMLHDVASSEIQRLEEEGE